jgi:hypothetical protein
MVSSPLVEYQPIVLKNKSLQSIDCLINKKERRELALNGSR